MLMYDQKETVRSFVVGASGGYVGIFRSGRVQVTKGIFWRVRANGSLTGASSRRIPAMISGRLLSS